MLTERMVRDAKAHGAAVTIWDAQVTGFGLQVTPKGKKNYIIRYRVGKVRKQAILCQAGAVELKEVRKRAAEELARIRSGDTDPLARRQAVLDAPTVADLWTKFEQEFVPDRLNAGRMRRQTFLDYRKQYRRYIGPALGSLRVADVSRADVEKFTRRVAHARVQRNRVLALLSRLFNLAEIWEFRPQHSNPCRGVTRTKESPRDRVLAPSEMQRLNVALLDLEAQHPYEVKAIFIAALTGLRISECLALEWQHVDLESGRAVVPETKTGKRIVPLAGPVKALLAAVPRLDGAAFVFPSLYTRRGLTATTYKAVRRVFTTACAVADLPDCRLHDLRRTIATTLAAAGTNAFTLRDVMGHRTLDMANRYVRMAGDALTDASELAATITAKRLGLAS